MLYPSLGGLFYNEKNFMANKKRKFLNAAYKTNQNVFLKIYSIINFIKVTAFFSST